MKAFKRFIRNIINEAKRPMTKSDMDFQRAICGGKKCPHCGEWI